MDKKNHELRRSFKFHLLQNPNYFGNLFEIDLPNLQKPVLKKIGDTSYEELGCLGYNPETEILTAMVEVKLQSGYAGGPCTDGSVEYVRFFLDYGDGTWVDHGAASFNAHDLGFEEPLCYAVSIRIDPKRTTCCDDRPVLPRVRAILSWNIEPPAGQPNWHPVWGNRLERSIQIDPRSVWQCKFLDVFDVGTVKIDPALLAQAKAILKAAPVPPKPVESLYHQMKAGMTDSKMMDQRPVVSEKLLKLRHIFPMVAKLAANKTDLAAGASLAQLKMFDIDLSDFADFLEKPDFNTEYEDLHCVGLDRDRSLLHGIVQVRREYGYSGGLCSQGSQQYIAFYLDFGSGWEYQGTTSVGVHDIPGLPGDGLWYQASLPVNLDAHRKEWCKAGRARIRGVLSWGVPPAPNQPDFVPHWGDRQDCWIELRPLPKGVTPGVTLPFLEAIGNMPTAQIDAAGYASGQAIGGIYTADDSPFGGTILISGLVAFPGPAALEYRVMVQGPSDLVAKPWTKTFDASVTTVIGSTVSTMTVTQTAPSDWYPYLPRLGPVVFRSVAGNLLAAFTAVEQGLHTVFVQIREQGTLAVLATSATEAFMVDNTAPVVSVNITSGGGNCSKFGTGEVLVGTYSMADAHGSALSLSVTPAAVAAGGLLAITSVAPGAPLPPPIPGPSASNGLSRAALTMGGTGASGNWELDTTGMKPCGYNIRIDGADRTIVNSGYVGWHSADIKGFCLD